MGATLWLAFLLLKDVKAFAQFEDVSSEHIVMATAGGSYLGCGLSCSDFNGDGWDDLTMSETDGTVKLYAGGPDGPELLQTLTGSGEGRGVLWIDVDQDGDLDLWVVRLEGPIQLYIQGEDGALTEESALRGIPQLSGLRPRGLSASDYDRDGDLDVYIATYHLEGLPVIYPNLLLKNNGLGTFSEVGEVAGVDNGLKTSFQGSWFDFDGDGWDDLWVINDRLIFDNSLYRNQGDGTFIDVAPDLGLAVSPDPMTATIFDPDQDGDWDLFATDVDNYPFQLWEQTPLGYIDVADDAGVLGLPDYGWGACVLDIDGDKSEDLMVATNFFPSELPSDNRVYMNVGTGMGFIENPDVWPNEQYPLYNLGRFDLNRDRAPDIAGFGSLPTVQLLCNINVDGPSRLALRLVGTDSNSHAVGAKIKVHHGGISQMQQIDAGCDYQTQHSYTRFFGLGDALVVDSLEVRWPTGVTETWFGLPADSSVVLIEGTADAALEPLPQLCPWLPQAWLVPFPSDDVAMTWNGVPVVSDTVWANNSGEYVLEASWWDGRFTWSSTVDVVVDEEPMLDFEVIQAQCPWDSTLVQWVFPDSGLVFVDGLDVTNEEGWMVQQNDTLQIDWVSSAGCVVQGAVVVSVPDPVQVAWTIQEPLCAGELGHAGIVISGGSPPWTVNWQGVDPLHVLAGSHPVSYSDSAGCAVQDTLEVEEPEALVVEPELVYHGLTDSVHIALDISGGTPPYETVWTGGLGGGELIAPGFLAWLVQDAAGCLKFATVEVPSNPLYSVEINLANLKCIRDEWGLLFSGPLPVFVTVYVHDLSGKMLYSGPVDEEGRIWIRPSGLCLIRITNDKGHSQVWIR